jgi:hypothetical protein
VTRLRKRKGRGAGGRRTVHLDDGILHPDAALLSHRGGGSVAAERGTAEHAAAPGDREARWKQGREAAAAGGVQGHQCFGRRRGAGEGSASHDGSGEEAAGQQQIAHPTCRARERASARVRAGEEEGGEEAKRGPALARGAWAWCGDWRLAELVEPEPEGRKRGRPYSSGRVESARFSPLYSILPHLSIIYIILYPLYSLWDRLVTLSKYMCDLVLKDLLRRI